MRRLQSAGGRPGSKGCLSAAGGQRDKRLLQLTRLTSINEIRTNTQAAVHVPQIYRPLFKISFLPQQPNCWVCQPNGKIWESVALSSGSEGGVWGSCIVCTLQLWPFFIPAQLRLTATTNAHPGWGKSFWHQKLM